MALKLDVFNLRNFVLRPFAQPVAVVEQSAPLGVVAVGAEVMFTSDRRNMVTGERDWWTFRGVVVEADTHADAWGDYYASVQYTELDGTSITTWLNVNQLTELE